ncbi:MAG TPA: holo-ACP synthase [Anaerolineaceae bacterium]|nr:holo-ACP synthase [Anaerolineaceae bacterium]
MLRNGVDIIEINRLEDLNPRIRERFINRVFTEQEKEICKGSFARLAGRFAAKEAVSKVLGTGIDEIHWKDIEILQGINGEPILQLHNKAKEKEVALEVNHWALSISHSRTVAIAFVIAE